MFQHSGLADKAGLASFLGEKIQEGKRQVFLIFPETASDTGDHILFRNSLTQLSCQGAECLEPAFADNTIRFFGYNAEMPGNFAVISRQGTVRKSVISFLAIAATLKE